MKRFKNEVQHPKDGIQCEPLQVIVTASFEDAMRRFKSLFQKEKIVAQLKEKQAYEKPSVKKRRKQREAQERNMLLEQRDEMIRSGEWEKRQLKKQQKRQNKLDTKKQTPNE